MFVQITHVQIVTPRKEAVEEFSSVAEACFCWALKGDYILELSQLIKRSHNLRKICTHCVQYQTISMPDFIFKESRISL